MDEPHPLQRMTEFEGLNRLTARPSKPTATKLQPHWELDLMDKRPF
jgi:hypothetical protein